MKTPHDEKIDEARRELSGEAEPAYLPFIYEEETEPEAEAEPCPRENPALKEPTEVEAAKEEVRAFFEKIAETLRPIMCTIAETLKNYVTAIKTVAEAVIDTYPNKRVVHLAKYGKGRTRKKNIKRILKHFEREAKKARRERP